MFLTLTFSRIFTMLRSHFWHGYSHESLLDLVHIFDMDILMNHYFTLTNDIWHIDEWHFMDRRLAFDMWTNDIWHMGDWCLQCGRMVHDLWTNVTWWVEDWHLRGGRVIFDMQTNDLCHVDKRHLICGRRCIWHVEEWYMLCKWMRSWHFLHVVAICTSLDAKKRTSPPVL